MLSELATFFFLFSEIDLFMCMVYCCVENVLLGMAVEIERRQNALILIYHFVLFDFFKIVEMEKNYNFNK